MNKMRFIIITAFWGIVPFMVSSQTITSEWSSIYINNTQGEQKNVSEARANSTDTIAPVLKIYSPDLMEGNSHVSNLGTLSIIGQVEDNTGIKSVLINSEKVLPNSKGIFDEEVQLFQGENNFTIIVTDNQNNLTERTLRIKYLPTLYYAEDLDIKGNYYALLIANQEYRDPGLFDLRNPVNDANALYEVLTNQYMFSAQNVSLLQNPGWEEVITSFDKLSKKLGPDDNLLIFYAGHGTWDPDANIGFWLPSDATQDSKTRWIRNSTIQDYLKEIKANHILLVSDACFSGSIFQDRSYSGQTSIAIKTLYDTPSRKAMTSGTLTTVPDESVFVKYLVDRLKNNDQKFLSAQELFNKFRMAVINNSEVLPQYGVVKNVGDQGGDFIFIMK